MVEIIDQAERSLRRLDMRGIRKRYGATIALDGVDVEVAAGEVHALIGENGAGKSTLMKALSGAIKPDAGDMFLDGEIFRPDNPLHSRLAGVAMIYQEFSLAPHLTVADNILLGMEPTRYGIIKSVECRMRAAAALETLGHPEIHPDTKVSRLSVAGQQLVEIARALAVGCRVLVLDEPTSSLGRNDILKLFDIIHRLKNQGIAIVYISHFLEEVKQIADRYTVLRDGCVAGSGAVSEVAVADIVGMMIGRRVEQLYTRTNRNRGEAILEINDLAGSDRLESASLTLYRGEVLGIAGLLGAGRTDLARTLFGLDPVRKGTIKLGAYLGPASPQKRWSQGMGLLSEDRGREGLAAALSVMDNLTLSKLDDFGPCGMVIPSRQERAAQRWIDELSIRSQSPAQRVAELSGGNQQKVALARLLHHEVDVLLLDEPTRGIDVSSKAQIYGLIDRLVSQTNPPKAVLMISSYMPELLDVCDRIAVMCRGRLGPARPVRELNEHSLMLAATGQADGGLN